MGLTHKAIVRFLLQAPIRQIAENEGSIVVGKVTDHKSPSFGNAQTGEYGDLTRLDLRNSGDTMGGGLRCLGLHGLATRTLAPGKVDFDTLAING